MRFFYGLALSALISTTALAQDAPPELMPDHTPPPANELLTPDTDAMVAPSDDVPLEADKQVDDPLDRMFAELKKASNPRYAKTIADGIWAQWFRSGSASIDLLLHWSNEAVQRNDFHIALDLLDQIVTKKPDFSEGWNRRATLHFMMNNHAKSMVDINRVLELEPRHFGALSGMALILEQAGHKQAALEAWQRTLDVYPAMENAQDALIRLEDELAGDPA